MGAFRQLEGRRYHPGESVPASGVYTAYHRDPMQEVGMVVLLKSEKFPPCSDCGADVRFELAQAAPHVFDDEDFRAAIEPEPPSDRKTT